MAHLTTDLPINSKGLTVEATLTLVEQQGKFTQDEAAYMPQADSLVCGTCRFFLRPETGTVGRCQVVDGEINWNGTSLYYISAEAEAEASLMGLNAYSEDDEKEERNIKATKFSYFIERVKSAFNEFFPVEQTIEFEKSDIKQRIDEIFETDNERAISFERIREQAWGLTFDAGRLMDVYQDNGQMYALLSDNGHLLRQELGIVDDQVQLAGEPFRVSDNHPPIQTRTTIQRQIDGQYRWWSISATSVLNRVGEIDSRDLFDSFIDYIDKTDEYPIRQFYHQGPRFRTGQCDDVFRDGNCLITTGLFDNNQLAKVEIAARKKNPTYWGESIGYLPTTQRDMVEIEKGINIPVYNTGIFKEISNLPEKEAASLFTITQQEEVNQTMNARAKVAFIKSWVEAGFTEDQAEKWLDENPNEQNRTILNSDMITRDKSEEDKPILEVGKINTDLEDLVIRQGKQVTDMIKAVTTLVENQTKMIEQMNGFEERFAQVEESQTNRTREAIENMPTVPQVLAYQGYIPRQGSNTQQPGQQLTMAERANNITPSYGSKQ